MHVCKREEYNYGYKTGCGVFLCETRSYFLRPFDLWLRDVCCLAWWPTQPTNQGLDTHRGFVPSSHWTCACLHLCVIQRYRVRKCRLSVIFLVELHTFVKVYINS